MKLYRIRNTVTGKFYRHRYSQYRGGDWVEEKDATVWTKAGGAAGALGAVREKARAQRKKDTFALEIGVVDPATLVWIVKEHGK
jgi:hypothetical protein